MIDNVMKDFITLSISDYERAQKRQSSTYTTQIIALDTTGMDPPYSSQNRAIKNHLANFYTIGVRLRLAHIGFSLIWEKSYCRRLAPYLEYIPEKSHLWSQYFDFANLEFTAKSTTITLCPTGPLENMSLGLYEIISSVYHLLHNIVPWISWLSNQVSSCTWKTMFLEAHCDQQLTS